MRLIQISAWNDSGGGFTHRLFDGHPMLRIWPYEMLFGRDKFSVDAFDDDWFRGRFRWPRLHNELASDDFNVLFDAISDTELKSALEVARGSKHVDYALDITLCAWRTAARESWSRCGHKTQAAFLTCYVDTLFACLGDAERGDGQVLGHCPVAILDASETWADFPQTRFLHVVRSPYGGFMDMRHRHPSLEASAYARKWVLVNGAAAMWAGKRPDQVKLVALPSLVYDRERTMRRLAADVGLAFDPILLRPTWRGRALDPSCMGPFGGVPDLAKISKDHAPPELSAADAETIGSFVGGTSAILRDLGLTLA